jgi:hypothetical protein
MNNHVQFGFTFEQFSHRVQCKSILWWWPSWISDWHKKLELCRGSTSDQWQLIHKCLIYQRRKQKTTPTNDKMTATVPTFLCIFLLHHLQTKD